MRKQTIIISVVVLALIMMATVVGCGAPPGGKEITIGNKNFTEQYIVGELMKQLLEKHGFTVELKSGRSSDYLREGIEFSDIDVCGLYRDGLDATSWSRVQTGDEQQRDLRPCREGGEGQRPYLAESNLEQQHLCSCFLA